MKYTCLYFCIAANLLAHPPVIFANPPLYEIVDLGIKDATPIDINNESEVLINYGKEMYGIWKDNKIVRQITPRPGYRYTSLNDRGEVLANKYITKKTGNMTYQEITAMSLFNIKDHKVFEYNISEKESLDPSLESASLNNKGTILASEHYARKHFTFRNNKLKSYTRFGDFEFLYMPLLTDQDRLVGGGKPYVPAPMEGHVLNDWNYTPYDLQTPIACLNTSNRQSIIYQYDLQSESLLLSTKLPGPGGVSANNSIGTLVGAFATNPPEIIYAKPADCPIYIEEGDPRSTKIFTIEDGNIHIFEGMLSPARPDYYQEFTPVLINDSNMIAGYVVEFKGAYTESEPVHFIMHNNIMSPLDKLLPIGEKLKIHKIVAMNNSGDLIVHSSKAGSSASRFLLRPIVMRAPELVWPVPGTAITEDVVTFKWKRNDIDVEEWDLIIKSDHPSGSRLQPADINNFAKDNSAVVRHLPLDGSKIIALLKYKVKDAGWQTREFVYNMVNKPASSNAKSAFKLNLSSSNPPKSIEPDDDDLLLIRQGHRLAILPAYGYATHVPAPGLGHSPAHPLLAVPTGGKESLRVFHMGRGKGLANDTGTTDAVYPHAIAAVKEALKINEISGVVIKHLHEDHIRQIKRIVLEEGILAHNIYYPAVFATNPDAPGSGFAKRITALETELKKSGLATNFNAIPQPENKKGYHHLHLENDVLRIDLYGLNRVFAKLREVRLKGEKPPNGIGDAASLLMFVTHKPSGIRFLDVGDVRSETLLEFERAMGKEYRENVRNVRILLGFQHHMGKLAKTSDARGAARLVHHLHHNGGDIDIIIQSKDRASTFRLNQSTYRALVELGFNVHIAKEPGPGNKVATLTVFSDGEIVRRGKGVVQSAISSNNEIQSAYRRLARLREALSIHEQSGRHLDERLNESKLREAYRSVKRSLTALEKKTTEIVAKGATPETLKKKIKKLVKDIPIPEIVESLTVPYMRNIRERHSYSNNIKRFHKLMKVARETGRITPKHRDVAVSMLWRIDPNLAHKLVNGSHLSRKEKQRILRRIPQSKPQAKIARAKAGALLALTIAAEFAQQYQRLKSTETEDEDTTPFLNAIDWWARTGIEPKVFGVDDSAIGSLIEYTHSFKRVQELFDDNNLDYVTITEIPRSKKNDEEGFVDNWDAFQIWADLNIRNYRDWHFYISSNVAVKWDGSKYAYKAGDINMTTFGHEIKVKWVPNDRLTTILKGIERDMIDRTEAQIAQVRKGPVIMPLESVSVPYYTPRKIFEGKPRAIKMARFKKELQERLLYMPDTHHRWHGFSAAAKFYVFPNNSVSEQRYKGDVVVGGADYDTYSHMAGTTVNKSIFKTFEDGTKQFVKLIKIPYLGELMFANEDDLEFYDLDDNPLSAPTSLKVE
ncbi:MAG: hypothetical protein OEV42_00470 [Deltaproteobacteria bacterium]|nr:hypothetical protein [Deltaproteobacteria bacterium]